MERQTLSAIIKKSPCYFSRIALLALIPALISACREECKSSPQPSAITVNEPVFEWDTFELSALGVDLDVVWKGPAGTSTSQSFMVANAQLEHSGTYFLNVSDGECPPVTSSKVVQVTALPIPCTLEENSMVITGGQQISFDKMKLFNEDGVFRFYSEGSAGFPYAIVITVHFISYDIEVDHNRSFKINPPEGLGKAAITIMDKSSGNEVKYEATVGKVFMRKPGVLFHMYFCDMHFHGPGSETLVVSGHVKESS